jgi:hypothetical protein
LKEAVEAFEKAIEFKPDYAAARDNLESVQELLEKQRKPDKSKKARGKKPKKG